MIFIQDHKNIILKLILASVLLLSAMPNCSAVTLTYVDGTWSNAVRTGDTVDCPGYLNTMENRLNENYVTWGYPSGTSTCPNPPTVTTQSGYGFDGTQSQEVIPGAIINLGEFTHYNHPIVSGGAITSVRLSIYLNLSGSIVGPINYTVNHDETSNSGACPPTCCPSNNCCYWNTALSPDDWDCRGTCSINCRDYSYYNPPPAQYICCGERGDYSPPCCAYTPCLSPCPDRASFPGTQSDVEFEVDGKNYTLEILGFAKCDDPSKPVTYFVTQEGGENSSCLYGRISGNSPSINIVKYTNGTDVSSADDPKRPTFSSGCPVLWTYKVSNDGNVDNLTITDVTDNVTGSVYPHTPSYFVGGDTDSNGKLGLTEVWVYNVTGTAISCGSEECECAYSNNATVNATYAEESLTDNDTSYYRAITTRVNAGDDLAVCEIPRTVELTGTNPCDPEGTGEYNWTTNGNGTFDDFTKLIANYTMGLEEIARGWVNLTLSANGTCPSATASDIMNLTIVKKPNVVIVVIEPKQN